MVVRKKKNSSPAGNSYAERRAFLANLSLVNFGDAINLRRWSSDTRTWKFDVLGYYTAVKDRVALKSHNRSILSCERQCLSRCIEASLSSSRIYRTMQFLSGNIICSYKERVIVTSSVLTDLSYASSINCSYRKYNRREILLYIFCYLQNLFPNLEKIRDNKFQFFISNKQTNL